MNYYSEETIKKLNSYKYQIVATFFVIIALLISITIIKDLYDQTLTGRNYNKSIVKRSKIVALIILITTFYFLFVVYTNYVKNRNKDNFLFLVASELVALAAIIRFLNINKTDVSNEGDLI